MKKNNFLIFFISITFFTCSKGQIIKEASAQEFTQLYPQTEVLEWIKSYSFNFKPYPILQEYAQEKFPHQITFNDMYILKIPDATAYFCNYSLWGINGFIFINNYFIKENQIKCISPFYLDKTDTIEVPDSLTEISIDDSVAICSHLYPDCYGHFILDVLCQLALLEIHNVEYDYLCIPYQSKFMKEALELWGIPEEKIIPLNFNLSIQAKNIIFPTSTTQTTNIYLGVNYSHPFLIEYVKNKLLQGAIKKGSSINQLPKKIFI